MFKDKEGYVLGLFEDNQWLKYSLTSLNDDDYEVVIRFKGSGKIKLEINDESKIISLNSVNYKNKSIGVFKLSKENIHYIYIVLIMVSL